jgi:hypothetical protein
MSAILDLQAQPHNSMPYVHVGAIMDMYSRRFSGLDETKFVLRQAECWTDYREWYWDRLQGVVLGQTLGSGTGADCREWYWGRL